MSKTDKSLTSQSWQASVRIVEDFLKSDLKLDVLLEKHTRNLEGGFARRVHYLSNGVVRNLGWLQAILKAGTRKLPKKRLQAILLTALFEWSEAESGSKPQVVHFAVEQAKRLLSKPEAKFANALLRKVPELVDATSQLPDTPENMSRMFSHPQWMVDRWIELWGEVAAKSFLVWNQSNPKVYAFCPGSGLEMPEGWNSTQWPGFYEVQHADWQITRTWLAEGKAYIQDPSTRLGPGLLQELGVQSVLDLCAAPGGKSVQLLNIIADSGGLLVSVDVAGNRFDRLKENLTHHTRPGITQVQVPADVLHMTSAVLPQPEYDAVFVDVPCSNTGVLQRRPDIKWRQTVESLQLLVDLQGRLLERAAQYVKVSGCLVYSTCSVEPDENQGVIERFLEQSNGAFSKEKEVISLPWESGHDGAAAFLLRRNQ